MVEIDAAGRQLGDGGVTELAPALIQSIQHNGEQGKVTFLEELCLKDNGLTVHALRSLAAAVKLAAEDLRDLDLSNNLISVQSPEEAQSWAEFLESLGNCCVLRRLDLSGNALGPKGFEIMAKTFSRAEHIDKLMLKENARLSIQANDTADPGNEIDTRLTARLRSMSVSSAIAEDDEEGDVDESEPRPKTSRLRDGMLDLSSRDFIYDTDAFKARSIQRSST